MLTIRCSALPRIFACPASVEQPDIIIDQTSNAARMGTAAHEFYAKMVSEGLDTVDNDLVWDLASKHDVDMDELRFLCWNGLRMWRKTKEGLTNPESEQEHIVTVRNTFKLGGRMDLRGICEWEGVKYISISDYKSGWIERNVRPQVNGYALIDFIKNGSKADAKYMLSAWLTRFNIIDTWEMTADKLLDYEGEIMDIVTADTKRYDPSCYDCVQGWCPLQHGCSARLRYLQSSGDDIRAVVGGTGGEVTPLSYAALYPQYQSVMRVAEIYKEKIKQMVDDAGGTLGNLHLEEYEIDEVTYDQAAIASVLGEALQEHKISKTDLKAMVDAVAPPRMKGKLLYQCLEALGNAGKVEKKKAKKLVWKEKQDGE